MDLKCALRSGMRVMGPDDRDYGAVERYDDAAVYVQGRRVPFAGIERLDRDRLYLGTPELWSLTESGTAETGRGESGTGLGGEIRVPVVEEQLGVETGVVDLGEVRIHKTVEETEEVRQGPLDREDVQIERVRVDRPVDAPEQRRQEGDWLVIPIMEEVFVVQKQLMVREEIRIRKQLVTEEHEVREVIRRERATIEDTRPAPARTASGRPGDDAAWEALREEIRDADR
jgi:uncharacterized protein (TIGR02271 family)